MKLFLVLFLLLVTYSVVPAQSAADLRTNRQKLLREIEANNAQLASTKRDKEAMLQRIATLQRQIRKRQELVSTVQQEIRYTEESIIRNTEVAASLRLDLDRLKREYGQLLRMAYRARLRRSWIFFIFSADGFNDAYRRWQYLRQYNRYRRKQARLMKDTQDMLAHKLEQLATRRAEKEQLLGEQQGQQERLGQERRDKDQLLDKIKISETTLLAKLEKQEKARESLNTAIEKTIREEMDRQVREERDNTTAISTASANTATAGSSFNSLRGKLPWPCVGEMSKPFGKQPHPDLPNIQISNNGIDIAAGSDAPVKAVNSGKVVSTQFVPGYRHTVLIQHDTYYTVYSNLETLSVSKGQEVSTGTVVGRTGTDGGDLHFEIWQEKNRLDPTRWLTRR